MSRSRRLHPLRVSDLDALPATCPQCLLGAGIRPGENASWAHAAEREWGCCGYQFVHESSPVGYLLLAPPLHVPRHGPQSGGLSADAAVVMTIRVLPGSTGQGVGRQLVQAAAAAIARTHARPVHALEVRGTHAQANCALPPVGFLEATGFQRVSDHPLHPRLRLELDRTVRWRPQWALRRVQFPRLVRPAPPEPAGRQCATTEAYATTRRASRIS